MRSQVAGRPRAAFANTTPLVRLERALHLYPEPGLNAFASHHRLVAQAMDIYYGTVHFVVPPLVLVWLWRRHPRWYRPSRDTLIVVSLVGLATFALYPVAPPRLTPGFGHFVDTAVRYGGLGPLDRGHFVDTNPYAAMPSLHVAWSLWSAGVVMVASRRPVRAVALAYPLATLVVVMGTANHWLIDGLGGVAALALAVLAVSAGRRASDTGRQQH